MWQFKVIAQRLPLRVPPPLPRAASAYGYAAIASGRGEIIILAQATQVTPPPDNRLIPSLAVRAAHPRYYDDIPIVMGAKFAVIEQLTGVPDRVPRVLTVKNREMPSGLIGH